MLEIHEANEFSPNRESMDVSNCRDCLHNFGLVLGWARESKSINESILLSDIRYRFVILLYFITILLFNQVYNIIINASLIFMKK